MRKSTIVVIVLALLLILFLAYTPVLHYMETRELLLDERSLIDLGTRDFTPEHLQTEAERSLRAERPKIVVSLTTIPERINGLKYTIGSLLKQTLKPDEIAVNIPMKTLKGKEYIIPSWLTEMRNTRVKLYRPETDYGPASKLLFTLKRESPDTKIIVVDDDHVYPPILIETLVRYSDRYPDNAITTFPKNFIRHGLNKPPTMGRAWSWLTSQGFNHRSPNKSDLVMGVFGFVVKPRFFNDDIFDYSDKPDELKWVDDVHFSGQLSLNNIDILTPAFNANMLAIAVYNQQRKIGLITTVNANGQNDNKSMAYYWGRGAFQKY